MVDVAIERFAPKRHDVGEFRSCVDSLDRWLRHSAGQSQRRDAARTFVAVHPPRRVVGYYAALAGEVVHADATPYVRKGMSRHFPIPVAVIARLAVTSDLRGTGLGAALLRDALVRTLAAAEQVGIRAVVVHAIDDRAARFYDRYGFTPLTTDPRTLMVSLAAVRASLP